MCLICYNFWICLTPRIKRTSSKMNVSSAENYISLETHLFKNKHFFNDESRLLLVCTCLRVITPQHISVFSKQKLVLQQLPFESHSFKNTSFDAMITSFNEDASLWILYWQSHELINTYFRKTTCPFEIRLDTN